MHCLAQGLSAKFLHIRMNSIFKSRDITLSTKVYLVKAMVFPVIIMDVESWTIKKAEHTGVSPRGGKGGAAV